MKSLKSRKSKGIGLNQYVAYLSSLKEKVQRYQILHQARRLIVSKSIWLILEELGYFYPHNI